VEGKEEKERKGGVTDSDIIVLCQATRAMGTRNTGNNRRFSKVKRKSYSPLRRRINQIRDRPKWQVEAYGSKTEERPRAHASSDGIREPPSICREKVHTVVTPVQRREKREEKAGSEVRGLKRKRKEKASTVCGQKKRKKGGVMDSGIIPLCQASRAVGTRNTGDSRIYRKANKKQMI
jgi:hypothetical protein